MAMEFQSCCWCCTQKRLWWFGFCRPNTHQSQACLTAHRRPNVVAFKPCGSTLHTAGGCKWCGAKDSLQHRYFECLHTEDLRLQHAPLITALRPQLPDALVLCSWALLPPTHFAWLRLLDSVPTVCPPLGAPFRSCGWSEVFTDGSCLWQSNPGFRVAAWGAILASPCDPAWNLSFDGVIGSGCLPGLCQTSYRAELYAVAYVLHHAAIGGFRVKFFCDCLAVINRYLTAGKWRWNATVPAPTFGTGYCNQLTDLERPMWSWSRRRRTKPLPRRETEGKHGCFGTIKRLTSLRKRPTWPDQRRFGRCGRSTDRMF